MSRSQLALARRYRPHDFQSVVGQEATLRALMSALDNQRLHHAYLFTGTRGVGKTTLARIFAKALNCEQGISAKPCDTCSACQAINTGSYVDLIEVDAASRTKVEDTRELLENVQYLPTKGRFKIYLIDEVHMLSGHSFNALLKTLEEPPSHVKFLLATTDPQKLPVTVLSRCLQFHLQHLPFVQIANHLSYVLGQENASFENEALEELARAADGSMRDALSLLDQALAYGHGRVLAAEVRVLLGLTEKGRLIALFAALVARDAKKILQEIAMISNKAPSFASVLTELLTLIHQIAIAQQVPEAINEGALDPKIILSFANSVSPEEIQLYYQIGLLGQRDLPYAPTPQMGFEMILLRMLAFQPVSLAAEKMTKSESVAEGESVARQVQKATGLHPVALETLEKGKQHQARDSEKTKIENNKIKNDNIKSESESESEIEENISNNKNNIGIEDATQNLKQDKNSLSKAVELSEWSILIPALNLSGMTKELASHCTVAHWTEDQIHLSLHESQKPLLSKRNEERLQEAINQYFKKPIALKISTDSSSNKVNVQDTPAQQYQKAEDRATQHARHLIETDPNVLQMLQRFGAKIEHVSASTPKTHYKETVSESVINESIISESVNLNAEKIDLPWEDEA